MKYTYLLILLFSISINAQKVQQVEVLKNDNQISDLFEELGQNELKLDLIDILILIHFGQAPQTDQIFEELGQNELKLDLIDILAIPAFDITYERIQDPYSSYGASLFMNLGDNDSASRNWTDKFSVSPFYRFYFFNKRDFGGAGFFAEIFVKFSSGKHDVEYYNFNTDPNNPGLDYMEIVEENFFDIAPGASIGQKWVNKKGWTFQINGGVGRYLLNKDENDQQSGRQVNSFRPEAVFKGGFSIGKRF